MPDTSFIDFLTQIQKKDGSFPVVILSGFNEFLGEKIIKTFKANFLEEISDFNYRRYYFDPEYDECNWEEIISEVKSSSFFMQSRKVLVVTIRDEKKVTLAKYDKGLLEDYLKKPNLNTVLIIYFSFNTTKDEYKQLKKEKIDKFTKELSSPNCYNVDLDRISEIEFKRYITRHLKDIGKTITANALDKIVEMKEEDYISVLHQLPKLEVADVSGGKSIDSEDIDQIITGVEAHSIWDLTDAIEAEDTAKYLRILRYLFMNGTKAALIIGTLVTHYNKIYIAKFLLKRNYPVPEVGRLLGQNSYFLNKFIQTARGFTNKKLLHIVQMLYDLDYESKTSGEDMSRLSLQNFTFRSKVMTKSL